MHAFGLEVTGAHLPGLHEGPPAARRVALGLEVPDEHWPAHEAQTLLERRTPVGELVVRIDRHDDAGFRFEAPDHGVHVLSPDGTRLRSWPQEATWRRQRLLFAQVLPVAATLQGLEALHASAVALGGGVVAIAAASGTGKSSVALRLLAEGASPFTDDVLALEAGGRWLVAHPGPRFATAHRHELEGLDPGARARAGRVIADAGKLLLEPSEMVPGPLPLNALWLLDRGGHGALRATEVVPDVALLAAQGFVGVLDQGIRLATLLDTLAVLAATVPVLRAEIPAHVDSAAVARMIAAHA